MSETNKALPSVTETPWFWLMLFSLAGLAAVATIGPKFERREQSIETKFHARERGLGREAVEQTDENTPAQVPQWNPIFTRWPDNGCPWFGGPGLDDRRAPISPSKMDCAAKSRSKRPEDKSSGFKIIGPTVHRVPPSACCLLHTVSALGFGELVEDSCRRVPRVYRRSVRLRRGAAS